jgi:hypothetical protein
MWRATNCAAMASVPVTRDPTTTVTVLPFAEVGLRHAGDEPIRQECAGEDARGLKFLFMAYSPL